MKKLIDECGPGMEAVERTYERRIIDMADLEKINRAFAEIVDPVVEEAMVRCLERHPALVPNECRRRMVSIGSGRASTGAGSVDFQCGESFVLPLEVRMEELDVADPRRQPWLGSERGMRLLGIERPREEATHIAHYSNLDKLLDECGPGAYRARNFAFESGDSIFDTLGQIIDDALVECLKRRDLVPPECRDVVVPVHNPVLRGFVPEVGFRCGSLAEKASPE